MLKSKLKYVSMEVFAHRYIQGTSTPKLLLLLLYCGVE